MPLSEALIVCGETALSCSCTAFCLCVLSLDEHPPTEWRCEAWAGIRIDEGHVVTADLSGHNVAFTLDIPGKISRGNWTLGHQLIYYRSWSEIFSACNRYRSPTAPRARRVS